MGAPGQAGARFANRRPPGRDGMAPYQLLNQLERFLGFVVGHVGTIPDGSSAAWGCPSFSSLPHPPPGDRWCTSTGQAPRSEGGSDQERADGGSLISLRHGGDEISGDNVDAITLAAYAGHRQLQGLIRTNQKE